MRRSGFIVIIVIAAGGLCANPAWSADNTVLSPAADNNILTPPAIDNTAPPAVDKTILPPALPDNTIPVPPAIDNTAPPAADNTTAENPLLSPTDNTMLQPAPDMIVESPVEGEEEQPEDASGEIPAAPPEIPAAPPASPAIPGPVPAAPGTVNGLPETLSPPHPVAPSRPPLVVPPRPAPASPGGGFLVKFNNADVYEVIHTLGRIAEINYLIDPRVRGTVNVHTHGHIRKAEALELLFSILRVNGATAIKEGNLYHIVPMAESKMEPLIEGVKEEPFSPNRPTVRAFPLQFIAAVEMAKVIRPFLSAGGDVTEVPRANMILVTDTAGNMEKHVRLVELFDSGAFKSAGVRLFPLKFLDPEEMARNLDAIFGALDFGARGVRPAGINFVPLPRLNALLVASASPKTMDEVEKWIKDLDREPSGTSRTVRLYRVRHGKVKDMMAILEKLYPTRAAAIVGKTTEFKPQVSEPARPFVLSTPQGSAPPPAPAAATTPARPATTSEKKEGEGYDIIPDEPTNSLIIRGSASEYASILETLKAIDVYPRQVLLEVLVGEVQLDDSMKLGIDWTFTGQSGNTFSTVSMATSLASSTTGLQYVVDKTNRLTATFRALANDGKVSILSSPSVIAANGRRSKIQVADSVPITTASIVANSNPPVTTQTVEYRDVGVILSFTPYINDLGLVTLEIEQEVSEVSTTEATTTTNPSFFKRNVQTTLIATEDQSIVLGGLVKERKSLNREGLPFFSKIPLIGWIFGARSDILTRNELVIFITPRLIGSVEDGTRLSREFEERVSELKKRIQEAEGIRPTKAPAPYEQPSFFRNKK